jgi:UDP-N-acetylmuramyl tripeptide synthase
MVRSSSLRDAMAKGAAKSANRLSRRFSKGSGTVIGGRIGLAMAPHLLSSLAQGRDVILVSGTNGKTTTTAMIATAWGGQVASNDTGSNMLAGLTAALVSSNSSAVVLEVDESWLPSAAIEMSPRVVVLLNLSRDQLDRASEVRLIAERWRAFFSSAPSVVIVANANDPLVVYAAETATRVLWCDVPTTWIGDAVSCPHCTRPLHFRDDSWSSECGFSKPAELTTILNGELEIGQSRVDLNLALPGSFNRANAAVALTALTCVGIEARVAAQRVNELSSVAGRYSLRAWRGQQLRLLLAKNPAGFAALLATVASSESDVWIAINARIADGRDPSWLYDVPFELLRGRRVFCFGDRRLDLATRLDYADVAYEVVHDESAVVVSEYTVTVLANYTAFQEWRERSEPC